MPARADLIVTNARILTMDEGNPHAEAIAIRDGTIVAVGDRKRGRRPQGAVNARDRRRRQHRRARLHRSAHASVRRRCRTRHICSCPGCTGSTRCRTRCAPMRPSIRTRACCRRRAPTTRSCRPMNASRAIISIASSPTGRSPWSAPDHHTMWANTRALELAGLINGKTLGPGNEIVMGADGLAEGELREGEAFGPLLDLAGESRARLGLATGGEPDPKPTPRGTGAGPRHHEARAGMVRPARHHLDPQHGRQSVPARTAVGDRGRRRAALPGADTLPLQEFHDARRARQGVDDGRKIRFGMAVVGHGQGVLRRRARFLDGRHGRRLRRPAGLARRAAVLAARIRQGRHRG